MFRTLKDFLPSEILHFDAKMENYSTFRIGAKAKAYVEPRNRKELIKAVKVCKKLQLPYRVIGNASNILFSSKPINKVIISTRKQENLVLHQTTLKVDAGFNACKLILWCAQRGLSGLEHLYGIPATIGGMVINNAGAFDHQISDVVVSVDVLEGGRVKTLKKQELGFAYHYSELSKKDVTLLSVELELSRLAPSVIYSIIRKTISLRQEKQPAGFSAGSVFKKLTSGEAAARLIEDAGLKGLREGRAVVSQKHANFIINEGGATDRDVKLLIAKIKREVKNKFGQNLETEIEFIGEHDADYR